MECSWNGRFESDFNLKYSDDWSLELCYKEVLVSSYVRILFFSIDWEVVL